MKVIWSVEPEVVREAARICAGIAASERPSLVEPVRSRLDRGPAAVTAEQLRLAAAIANRTLSYIG